MNSARIAVDTTLHNLVTLTNESARAYDEAAAHFVRTDSAAARMFDTYAVERRRFLKELESLDETPIVSGSSIRMSTLPSGGHNVVQACIQKDRALLSACMAAGSLEFPAHVLVTLERQVDRCVLAIAACLMNSCEI